MQNAYIYVNTEYTVPGAEAVSGVEAGTGWVRSALYPDAIEVMTETMNELISDMIGDMHSYYDDRFVVLSDVLSEDHNNMRATMVAGINPDSRRIEPIYVILDHEWNDLQMLVEHEFLGCFR